MASKFGGKQAMQNQWVTQQNLARHKSVQAYLPKPKAPKAKAKAAPLAKPVPPADAAIETPPAS